MRTGLLPLVASLSVTLHCRAVFADNQTTNYTPGYLLKSELPSDEQNPISSKLVYTSNEEDFRGSSFGLDNDQKWQFTNDLYKKRLSCYGNYIAKRLKPPGKGRTEFCGMYKGDSSEYDHEAFRPYLVEIFQHRYPIIGMSSEAIHQVWGEPDFKLAKTKEGLCETYELWRKLCGPCVGGPIPNPALQIAYVDNRVVAFRTKVVDCGNSGNRRQNLQLGRNRNAHDFIALLNAVHNIHAAYYATKYGVFIIQTRLW